MKKLLSIIMLSTLLTVIASCGKSEQQKSILLSMVLMSFMKMLWMGKRQKKNGMNQ